MTARYVFAVEFRVPVDDPELRLDPETFETKLYRSAAPPGEEGWLFFRNNLWRGEVGDETHLRQLASEELGVDVDWTVGPDNTGPAFHHMGTTRMSDDPSNGVVNPQLRTHDLDNCFIASSSTFVTGGALNPTLTIAALALKCAEHVGERL